MEIYKLASGAEEPEGANYIKVNELSDGSFGWTGTVHPPAGDVLAGGRLSLASGITSGGYPYPTAKAAAQGGLDWARERQALGVYLIPPDKPADEGGSDAS